MDARAIGGHTWFSSWACPPPTYRSRRASHPRAPRRQRRLYSPTWRVSGLGRRGDVGGVVRARAIANRIDADLAIVDKRRERAGVSEVMNIIGDVQGRRCILVDDIIDSAGTVCNAANALREAGATSVMAYVTHGVLSGGAVARVASSSLEKLVITDSIQATQPVELAQNIRVLSIAGLIAEAMKRISEETSVSSLFE